MRDSDEEGTKLLACHMGKAKSKDLTAMNYVYILYRNGVLRRWTKFLYQEKVFLNRRMRSDLSLIMRKSMNEALREYKGKHECN